MKQFKKVLSVLLAVIIALTSVSVIASAYGTAWRDEGLARSQFNSIDVPTLTAEQYATAALDEVDRMLAEEQILLTEDDIFVGTLDVTSVNAALDSVDTILNGRLWTQYNGLLGDLKNLNIQAISLQPNCHGVRRSNGGSDLNVIYSLLEFLYDNKGLLSGFVKNEIDLGAIVGQFVDLSEFEVTGLLKDLLYEAAYDADAPDGGTDKTVDEMVQDLVDALFITGFHGDDPLLPEAEGYTNLSDRTMLQFVDDALVLAYNKYLVPRANEVWMDDINELLADNAEEIEKYSKYFNLTDDGKVAFEFETYNFDRSKLVLEQLNDVLASIINLAINSEELGFEWETGDNSKIVDNIIRIGREVLAVTGRDLFSKYVEIYDADQLAEMSDMEVVAYVARTILNSSIDGVWIPNTADNLTKVGSYLVKDLMATELPGRDYSSETTYPVDDVNTIYTILTDFGVKALNENPGLDLSYGIGIDGLATAAANWAITKYGGLLSGAKELSTSNTGWNNLNTLIFKILRTNWFDASLFNGKPVTVENLVKDVLIGNILNLDLENVIALLTNKSSSSEIVTKTPKQLVLDLLPRILNIVFPNFLKTNMTQLGDIISPANLGDSVDALFSDLYNNRKTLAPAVLPIVTDVLDLTTPSEFKSPVFDLKAFNYFSTASANTSFEITNRSYGVNTGYTDPVTGQFHRDDRFALEIVDVVIDGVVANTNPPQHVTTLTVNNEVKGAVIDGGETVTATITGKFTGNTDTVVTIKYNILKEDGQPLTSDPLEARIYTCFSNANTDDINKWSQSSGNLLVTDGFVNIYTTNPKDLAGAEFKFKNNTANNATLVGAAATPSATQPAMTKVSFIEVNDEERNLLPGGSTSYKPLKINGYTGSDEQLEEAFTSVGYKKYTQNIGAKLGTNSPLQKSVNIILYKDYGLTSLFNSEVNAQRQRSDYNSDAFDAYLTAMADAAKLIKCRKNNTQFTQTTAVGLAYKFEGAATALTSAIEALEASAVGGVAALRARLDEIDPSNADKDFMTDGDYSFFGAANYLTYTWSNFRDKQKDADNFAEYYEEGGKGYLLGEKPEALDVAMKTWELNNYYARLRPVDGSKVNLSRAINQANAKAYVEDEYTAESYERYTDALAFATSVNNEAGAVQKKINMAYIELIEAQKHLYKGDEEPAEEELVIVPAEANPFDTEFAPVVLENTAGEKLLYGIAPEEMGIDISEYFIAEEGSLSDVDFVYEALATGETLQIVDKATEEVLAEYIIVIKGDLDCDGTVGTFDITNLARNVAGLELYSETLDSARDYAGDIDLDGEVGTFDVTSLARCVGGTEELNFASNAF